MDFMKRLQRIAAVTAAVILFAPAAFAAERAISHNELIDKLSGFLDWPIAGQLHWISL